MLALSACLLGESKTLSSSRKRKKKRARDDEDDKACGLCAAGAHSRVVGSPGSRRPLAGGAHGWSVFPRRPWFSLIGVDGCIQTACPDRAGRSR